MFLYTPECHNMSQTSAKVIAHTISADGAEIVTIEYEAPRFLLAEINTHGVIAKSAASSRAIPVEKRIQSVANAPFVPVAFGKNARGMQARGELGGAQAQEAYAVWQEACDAARKFASRLVELDVHKQHANRLLEPFCYAKGVLTATEWDNFFSLRLHPDAQPEFQELAREIDIAIRASKPIESPFHLPYVGEDVIGRHTLEERFMISAARCARVSYKLFDGTLSTVEKDIELCQKLISSGHMSPFDHPAEADRLRPPVHGENTMRNGKPLQYWERPDDHGRFWGWIPLRVDVQQDLGVKARRSSFEGVVV
jgi:hypothetical protein